MWTPAAFFCHRTPLVPRARQEIMDSRLFILLLFWGGGEVRGRAVLKSDGRGCGETGYIYNHI